MTVQLPNIPGIMLTLQWDVVPGASGYKLYRTPYANQSLSEISLLVILSGGNNVTYNDDGHTGLQNEYPLPVGSLGKWATLSETLNIPRYGHSVVTSPNPLNSSQYFIFIFGGVENNGKIIFFS